MFATKYLIAGSAILGLLGGVAVGGYGAKAVYDHFVIPAMTEAAEKAKTEAVNAATARCEEQMTSAITVAAEKARTEERARQEQIYSAALEQYRQALQQSEAQLAAAREEQERKDREYEAQLSTEGRTCPLSSGDIDYLNGVRQRPN